MTTHGQVDLDARRALHAHAWEIFRVVQDILRSLGRGEIRTAMHVLEHLENDQASESSAVTWEVWHRLSSEHPSLVNHASHEVTFRKGHLIAQVHHWIEVALKGERYIIDVAPPDGYSGPILLGSRSPLVLVYG
jgi:hypothetical protein